MRRWLLVGAAVLALPVIAALAYLGIVPGVKGRYGNSDPALAVAYRAKDTCSCLFVMKRDEAHCRAWTRVSPDVAGLTVDPVAKVITSSALGIWRARARWVDERSGCVLEERSAAVSPPSRLSSQSLIR